MNIYLFSKKSGKCLDVRYTGTSDGASIQQWQFHGAANQVWNLQPSGDGYFKVMSKHSNKYLSVSGHERNNGTAIIQWKYYATDDQQWEFIRHTDGSYRIGVKESTDGVRKCLYVEDGRTDNEAPVVQWDYLDDDSQKWLLVTDIALT